MERREQIRFGVRTLVVFEWKSGEVSQRGQGLTRDISNKGMFIYSDSSPPVRTDVELVVTFAPFGTEGSELQMTSKANVLRVESHAEHGSSRGFAVVTKSYRLHAGSTLVEDHNWEKG